VRTVPEILAKPQVIERGFVQQLGLSSQKLDSPSLRVVCDGAGSAVVSGRGRSHCAGMNDNLPMPGCRVERITRDGIVNLAKHLRNE
jgi:hypothetical protein